MRTVRFKSVLHGAAYKMGFDPYTPDLSDEQAMSLTEFINTTIREVWDHAHWPESILIEQRYYRDQWDAAVEYDIGDEVWHSSSEKYYSALTSNTNMDPAVETSDWEEAVDMRKYLPYSQTGKTDIDALIHAYQRDPRIITAPEELCVKKLADGYQFGRLAPDAVFIEYRARAPQFSSVEYSAGIQYAVGDVVYVPSTGECYKALIATEGMDPVTTLTDWAQVEFPYFASEVVKEYAYSYLLLEDGEAAKAKEIRSIADDMLTDREIIEFEQQGQQEQFSVRGI